MNVFKVAVVCAAIGVAGCQSSVVSETGPLLVQSVSVQGAETLKAETNIASSVKTGLDRTLMGRDAGGTPSTVDVTINTVTYKNPALSLLVNTSNSIASDVTIRNSETGEVLAQFPQLSTRDVALQGVFGAVQSLTQDRQKVDAGLAETFSENLEKRIFGDAAPDRVPQPTATPVRANTDAPQSPDAAVPVS